MASSTDDQSVYPPPDPGYDTGYRYQDVAHSLSQTQQPPRQNQTQIDSEYQDVTPTDSPAPVPRSSKKTGAEVKPRLRKACDSCSARKVKCDESGPPCKSCAALDIPCTFERPSRRRGPPNRHAEEIKRRRLASGGYELTGSPTTDAAYGLAALSVPQPPAELSAESICDIGLIRMLVDDYFTFIHPLIPIPHEPTFRHDLEQRKDRTDRTFLALLAGMIETLVSSFPRRPRQRLNETARAQFPSAKILVDRCHAVFVEARGIGFLDRDLDLHDACASYLAGLSAAYTFDLKRWRLYAGECVMILRTLGFQKPEIRQPNEASMPPVEGYISQQIGRRLFWLCFVGALSVRQLGGTDSDVLMPNAHSEGLPPMAIEVDDVHIFYDGIAQDNQQGVSIMTGFNWNVRIFQAFHYMTAIEMAIGQGVLYDWDRQRHSIRAALRDVKAIMHKIPVELRLQEHAGKYGEWPPRDPSVLRAYPALEKRVVQYEIQKANIYATQLATRSYLVERFWNLYEIHEKIKSSTSAAPKAETSDYYSSPTITFMANGIEDRFQPTQSVAVSDVHSPDAGERDMGIERENIIRDMALLIRSVNQVNMEPNGHSFCHKLRQVASTLLPQDRTLMSHMPTFDAKAVNDYLNDMLSILQRLERLGSDLLTHSGPSNLELSNQAVHNMSAHHASNEGISGMYGASGVPGYAEVSSLNTGSGQGQYNVTPMPASGMQQVANAALYDAGFKTQKEIEEEELVQWASLKSRQEQFVTTYGGYFGSL